jgi:hypothetical protein
MIDEPESATGGAFARCGFLTTPPGRARRTTLSGPLRPAPGVWNTFMHDR